MRNAIIALFILLCLTMATGFYLRYTGDLVTGDRFIGVTILAAVFILMPMFLYYRWKGRSVKDYMLDGDNLKKMREFSNDKKRKKNE